MRWHQDATFFDTAPISVTTFWFALEDATIDNGCLWAEPGRHRGPLRERFIHEGDAIRMEKLDAMPWPSRDSTLRTLTRMRFMPTRFRAHAHPNPDCASARVKSALNTA